MEVEITDLDILFNFLKHLGDESNAGRAFVEFTIDDGGVFRIEYKRSKKG